MFPVNTGQKEVGEGGGTTLVGKRGSICARGPVGRSHGLGQPGWQGSSRGAGGRRGSGLGAGPGVQSVVLSEQLFLPSKLTLVWLQQL